MASALGVDAGEGWQQKCFCFEDWAWLETHTQTSDLLLGSLNANGYSFQTDEKVANGLIPGLAGVGKRVISSIQRLAKSTNLPPWEKPPIVLQTPCLPGSPLRGTLSSSTSSLQLADPSQST